MKILSAALLLGLLAGGASAHPMMSNVNAMAFGSLPMRRASSARNMTAYKPTPQRPKCEQVCVMWLLDHWGQRTICGLWKTVCR